LALIKGKALKNKEGGMESLIEAKGFLSARTTLASDVSFLFALTFPSLFLISGYMAMQNQGALHHKMILFSMVSMFAYFVFYYRVRRLGLDSFADQARLLGDGTLLSAAFKPVLWTHFLVVCLSSFFGIYTIISGFKAALKQNGRMILINRQVTLSRTAWSISFIWLIFLGWWLQVVHAFDTIYKIIFLIFGYFLPASIALVIHKLLPFSERRHRILGKLCLLLFACLIVTSTLAYSLLYIF